MSATTTTNHCPNCGPYPCYHICPNSPHYYSPEQEMADEASYDPREYYREGGFEDPDPYADEPDFEIDTTGLPEPVHSVCASAGIGFEDDNPF